MGVAFGPIVGGWLLEHFWWGSAFLAMAPVAAVAVVLVVKMIPSSRDPEAPRLDFAGLVLSTAALATLVYTIIEAPGLGWSNATTLGGFAAAAMALAVFVAWERRVAQPIDSNGLEDVPVDGDDITGDRELIPSMAPGK